MANEEKRKAEPEVIEAKAKVERVVDPYDGLVKMAKSGQTIHAHPNVVKEHEKNGWKVS